MRQKGERAAKLWRCGVGCQCFAVGVRAATTSAWMPRWRGRKRYRHRPSTPTGACANWIDWRGKPARKGRKLDLAASLPLAQRVAQPGRRLVLFVGDGSVELFLQGFL